jgi:hypothetical protein
MIVLTGMAISEFGRIFLRITAKKPGFPLQSFLRRKKGFPLQSLALLQIRGRWLPREYLTFPLLSGH